jgi:formamidopyrimidine-DNA glycosylase
VPELPEVETVARDLRPRLVGAEIVGVRSTWARTLRGGDADAFAAAVTGRTVDVVRRRAKQLVIDLSGDVSMTIHLKMTGQLFVVPASMPDDPYVRLVLELDGGRELRFRDVRKFGKVGVYRRAPDESLVMDDGKTGVFAATGPEPLDDAFTLRDFRRRLRARRGRLKPLLTDQSFLAGIGNIYADEALWLARLHPLRPAPTLTAADEKRLFDAIRSVLGEAVARRGSSVDDYTAPDGDGEMQERLQVYQRTGRPCPRCGRPIRRIVVGGRSTHFCSWCQRLRARDRSAVAAILRATDSGARRGDHVERTRRAAETRRAAARQSSGAESVAASPQR